MQSIKALSQQPQIKAVKEGSGAHALTAGSRHSRSRRGNVKQFLWKKQSMAVCLYRADLWNVWGTEDRPGCWLWGCSSNLWWTCLRKTRSPISRATPKVTVRTGATSAIFPPSFSSWWLGLTVAIGSGRGRVSGAAGRQKHPQHKVTGETTGLTEMCLRSMETKG